MDEIIILKNTYLIIIYLIVVLLAVLSLVFKKHKEIYSISSIIVLIVFSVLEVLNGASYYELIVLLAFELMLLLANIKLKEENV